MKNKADIVIIGAGMSGYAVAARLVELGNKVTMIAKTDSWTGIGGSVFALAVSISATRTGSGCSAVGNISACGKRKTLHILFCKSTSGKYPSLVIRS